MDAGALSALVDNYDLNIFTSNGCRGSHALATDVTQHPLPTDENCQQPLPKIPRLKKKETSRMDIVQLPSNALHQYHGPSRSLPKMFPDHDGMPLTEASKKMEDLEKALQSDTEWLAHVLTNEDLPMEWAGYMNHVAREEGFISKETNNVHGPLIDAPPSHPNTILTSIMYLEEFLNHMERSTSILWQNYRSSRSSCKLNGQAQFMEEPCSMTWWNAHPDVSFL